jgi:hypothetical protein
MARWRWRARRRGPNAPPPRGAAPAGVAPATWQKGQADAQLIHTSLGSQSIVGLWAFKFMSGATQVDWGYTAWHSDGTEITNSGGHSPASGNWCLGTWRQSGPQTYHLKHFPLAYDPQSGALVAKIVLTEDVTVAQGGDTFSGTFSIQAYAPDGVTKLGPPQTGTATGQRIEPD